MVRDNSSRESAVNRRRYLATLGTGAILGLAGCGGGDDGGGGQTTQTTETEGDGDGDGGGGSDGGGGDQQDGDGSSGDGMLDATFRVITEQQNIRNKNMNTFSPTNVFGDLVNLFFDPVAFYHRPSGDYIWHVVEGWSYGDTIEINMNDEFTWHTGDPVTAEDLATYYKLGRFMQGTLSQFVESVSVVDETTVELQRSQTVSQELAAYALLRSQITTPHERFNEWVQRFEDASSDDGVQSVRGDFVEETWPVKDAYGYGSFKIDEIGDIGVELSLFEDHPYSDSFNFPNYTIVQANEEQAFQMATSDEIDGIQAGLTKQQYQGLMDRDWYTTEFPWGFGRQMLINYDEVPELKDRRVRQALHYAIDKSLATRDSVQFQPINTPTGLVGTFSGTAFQQLGMTRDEFINYEKDAEKAASLMEEAGFSKEDGTWVGSDGSPLSLGELPFVSIYAPVLNMVRSVATQLQQFGVQVEMASMEPAQVSNRVNNGNFSVIDTAWGGFTYLPYFNLDYNLTIGETSGGGDPFHQGNFNNYSEKGDDAYVVTVPPVGEPDAEASEELDILAALNNVFTGNQRRQNLQRLAWFQNWAVPSLHLQEYHGPHNYFHPDWDVPDEDHQLWDYQGTSVSYVNYKGHLKATPDAVE